MRRFVMCLTLILLTSSPSQASPMLPGEFFTPQSVFLDVDPPRFANGSDTFCWLCSDSNPANDLKLVLTGRVPGTFEVAGFPEFFGGDTLGSLAVNGPASNFQGLNVAFTFSVKTTVTTKINPDHSPELLPQPSVARGQIQGAVIGFTPRVLELRYNGQVDGVTFEESMFPQIVFVPPGGTSKAFTTEIFVAPRLAYTPEATTPSVVPEPLSLLLLSSGLAAAAIRRRRTLPTRP